MKIPKVTFGMIVLNGQPFVLYNLRSIYPFASQIIVVEGASLKAAHAARPDGHSIDDSLESLKSFQQNEDPKGILTIVTAEDEGHNNGFWPGEKDEQSKAYSKRATGDWLWQIDVDEFYRSPDMRHVCEYLCHHPEKECLSFSIHQYWGGFDYLVDGGLFMSHAYAGEPWGAARRLFRWTPESHYTTHRPPTVVDGGGRTTTDRATNITQVLDPPCFMFHYPMLFFHQYMQKGIYYDNQNWQHEDRVADRYAQLYRQIDTSNVFSIFTHRGTHNWLIRNTFSHPELICRLQEDLKLGSSQYALRSSRDIEAVMNSNEYMSKVIWMRRREWIRAVVEVSWYRVKRFLKRSTLVRGITYSIKSWFTPRGSTDFPFGMIVVATVVLCGRQC